MKGIQLTAGFTATLNVSMAVGAVSESITVVGASPLIDVTNAIVSTTFTEKLTAVLPTVMTSSRCWPSRPACS